MTSQKFAVLAPKKGGIRAFSLFRTVNLVNDSVKIPGCSHSYNSQLANYRNFCDTIKFMANERFISARKSTNL